VCSDDGADATGSTVVAFEEVSRGVEQRVDGLEQFAVGDLPAVMPPQHLAGIQPWAVGREIQQDELAGSPAQHGLDLLILVGAGIVPGHVNGLVRVLGQQGLQEFRDFAPTFTAAGDDHGLAGVPVDHPQTIPARGLGRRRDYDLLADRAPQGAQGRMPADVEFVGIVEDLTRFQAIAGFFNRLF
jgi:hypothetical protein